MPMTMPVWVIVDWRAVQGAGDAEVHHLDRAGLGDDDVRGLDVAVHDAVLVRVREGFEHAGVMISACSGPGASALMSSSRMVWPSTSSITMYGTVSRADLVLAGVVHGDDGGWLSPATDCASRGSGPWNRVLGAGRRAAA